MKAKNEILKIKKLKAFTLGEIPILSIEKSLIGKVSCPTPLTKKLSKKSSKLNRKQRKKLLKIELLSQGS